MTLQFSNAEELSAAETDALSRFVRDLRMRMKSLVQLLEDRGTSNAATLAESIEDDLCALERELSDTVEISSSRRFASNQSR